MITRYLYITIVLFLSSQIAFSQVEPKKKVIKVSGIIYDEKSSERVPFVHIIDITRNTGTSADDNGNFSFNTYKGDTIRFTAIGYSDQFLYLDSLQNSEYLVIYLAPKSYLLESMDFYANDPMKGFYLKDIKRDTIRFGGSKGNPGAAYWNVLPSGGSGYITGFANLFNKHAKQEKKLKKILAEEQAILQQQQRETLTKKTMSEKYSVELVSYITNLTGRNLDYFMLEYRPSNGFIMRATDYDIALQIVESFRDYMYDNGLEVDMDEILRRAKFRD